jgi:agmatinase
MDDLKLHFHGDDVAPAPAAEALFYVIPAPLERSVSYGSGTACGPAEILRASAQLELFDGKSIPAEHGIYTDSSVDCGSANVEQALDAIQAAVGTAIAANSLAVLLGGEHTVSLPAVKAIKAKHASFGIIHFDAHADLREEYNGSPFSHASVMKRIFDLGVPLMQIGTRSYSLEEQEFREKQGITYFDAEKICREGLDVVQLPAGFPEKVYLSFDIDALDSAVFPATGTPVPGGLSWYQAMWLVERLLHTRICLGFDLVEFAPIKNLHSCSFAAAQLVYNVMGYITRSPANQKYWHLAG